MSYTKQTPHCLKRLENMMKEFLYYPKLMFSCFKYGEASAYFYTEEYSAKTTEFATIIDNCSFSRTTHVTITINEEKTDFHGENCVEDAKEFINSKFDEIYPKGLHWVENYDEKFVGLYLGNVQLAQFVEKINKNDFYKFQVSGYHKSKFFADKINSTQAQDLLDGKAIFAESDFDKMKEVIMKMIDLDRFELERSERKAAILESKKAEDQFLGLPELTGTEKQIKWAIDLRKKYINAVGVDSIVGKKWKKTTHKAKFWIDNRDIAWYEITNQAFLK